MSKVLDFPLEEHILNGICIIPEDIAEIGESAFVKSENYTYDIKAVVFPKNLLKIGNRAFYDCLFGIEEIILPENLEEISEWAFGAIDTLKKIVINSHIKRMGSRAFVNIPKECSIIFTNSEDYTPNMWPSNWNEYANVIVGHEEI